MLVFCERRENCKKFNEGEEERKRNLNPTLVNIIEQKKLMQIQNSSIKGHFSKNKNIWFKKAYHLYFLIGIFVKKE